jgi:hypothetical protein
LGGQRDYDQPAVFVEFGALRQRVNVHSPKSIQCVTAATKMPLRWLMLTLYHDTTGGEAALARKRREDAIRVTGRARNSRPFLTAHAAPREMH